MVKLTHFDINQFTPFSVGFDRVFDRLVDYGTTYETGGFPPYNICLLYTSDAADDC